MRTARAATLILAMAALLRGQTFEVAAIKPGSGALRRIQFQAGGQFVAENASLRVLIEQAFEIQPKQLVGGPAWLDSVGFDVQARGSDSATRPDVRKMLQALLAERFQLNFHLEKREQSYYALAQKDRARVDSKMVPSAPEVPSSYGSSYSGPGATSNKITVRGHTMPQFAVLISREVERIVLDETGLAGAFSFEFEATREEGQSNPFVVPWAPALGEIGLRLDSRRGPVEMFVIDGAQLPSEN